MVGVLNLYYRVCADDESMFRASQPKRLLQQYLPAADIQPAVDQCVIGRQIALSKNDWYPRSGG